MFNRKSIYAPSIRKIPPNAIAHTGCRWYLISPDLVMTFFSNEEEFLRWKKISDMDYHGEEKS